jgi:hypothetical protein
MKMKERETSINELHTSLDAAEEKVAGKYKENQKLLETLNQLWDNCFTILSRCCDTVKKIFFVSWCNFEDKIVRQRGHEGALAWIEKELSEVETIISTPK